MSVKGGWVLDHRNHDFSRPVSWLGLIAFTAILVGYVAYSLLASDRIFANVMPNDNFIFFDGAYRISQGQTPHLDFVTALGAFVYLIPGILTKYWGAMFAYPIFFVGLAASFAVMSLWYGRTRLNVPLAYLLVILVVVLVAAPNNIDQNKNFVTFAMFYNRLGYAALTLLLIHSLPHRGLRGRAFFFLDVLLLSVLGLTLLHLKIPYFLGFIGITLLMALLGDDHRLEVLYAYVAVISLSLLLEYAKPGYHHAYLDDIIMASEARRGGSQELLRAFIGGVREHAFYLGGFLFIAIHWIGRGGLPRHKYSAALMVGGVLLGAVGLLKLNCQHSNLVLGYGCLLYLTLLASQIKRTNGAAYFYAILLVISMCEILPYVTQKLGVIERYHRHAKAEKYSFEVSSELERFVVVERGRLTLPLVAEKSLKIEELVRIHSGRQPKESVSLDDYIFSLGKGLEVIKDVQVELGVGSVSNLDFSNPFSLLLGLSPPKGGYAWIHDGLNISRSSHEVPDKVFGDTKYILVPKLPIAPKSKELLIEIYGEYIQKEFVRVRNTQYWDVWYRTGAADAS